ncbi:MAG: hypothetical protein Kow0089_16200 [Desulfobulbaceae bacterium]
MRYRGNDGWTLIELTVVMGVILILAAIAIPNYIGFQNKAKRRVINEIAASARPELRNWMESAHLQQEGVIDVNGDGIITPGEVINNSATVPNSWIQAFVRKKGKPLLSPWNSSKPLFTVAPLVPPNTGQITLSLINNNRTLLIRALDNSGNIEYNESVSVE